MIFHFLFIIHHLRKFSWKTSDIRTFAFPRNTVGAVWFPPPGRTLPSATADPSGGLPSATADPSGGTKENVVSVSPGLATWKSKKGKEKQKKWDKRQSQKIERWNKKHRRLLAKRVGKTRSVNLLTVLGRFVSVGRSLAPLAPLIPLLGVFGFGWL